MSTGKTFPEKKRGRPRSRMVEIAVSLWPDVTTRRSHRNKASMVRATGILREADPELWRYFCDGARVKLTTMYELGRIRHPQDVIDAAKAIRAERLDHAGARALCRMIRRDEVRS